MFERGIPAARRFRAAEQSPLSLCTPQQIYIYIYIYIYVYIYLCYVPNLPSKESPSFRQKMIKRDLQSFVLFECIKRVWATPAANPGHTRDVDLFEKRIQTHPERNPWNVHGYARMFHAAPLIMYEYL